MREGSPTTEESVVKLVISAIINTKNEAGNLPRALSSLSSLADEVIVADMASTDATRTIATQAGARILEVEDVGYVEPARRQAVEAASHDWILLLDADEIVTPALGLKLKQISQSDEADCVEIHFSTWMFGQENLHSGWSLEWEHHLRFFKRDLVVLPNAIHGAITTRKGARTIRLPAKAELAIVHYNYTDWSSFLQKVDRYTSFEATEDPYARGPAGPQIAREFVGRYLRDGGWKAGRKGLLLSLLMVCYRLLVSEKRRLAREVGSKADILGAYDRHAESLRN